MRELGPEEESYHRQTGEYAAAAGVRLLWGVGPLSEATAEGFALPACEQGDVRSGRTCGVARRDIYGRGLASSG